MHFVPTKSLELMTFDFRIGTLQTHQNTQVSVIKGSARNTITRIDHDEEIKAPFHNEIIL